MSGRKEYEMLFKLNAQLGGSYASTFKQAQSALSGMKNDINALNKTAANISAFQKQQQQVEATRAKLLTLQQQYENLQKAQEESGASSVTLQNQMLSKQLQIDKTSTALGNQEAKLGQLGDALKNAGVDTNNLAAEQKKLEAETDGLKKEQRELSDEYNNAKENAKLFGSESSSAISSIKEALVAAGLVAALKEIFDGLKACAGAAIEFESTMTGVAKTTDLTDEEFAAMSSEIRELSMKIPITTKELGAVAETAGQLGIAKEDLLDFTTVMSMLGTATTMTAEDAATMLAQFANITQMDPADYGNLASAIVDLGNNYATTEQKITDMSQGIAAAGSIAGMSEADMLGLSAAVTSLGIETQAGSTSMSKLISEINTAVETGEGLNEFARIANMNAEQFTKLWGEDAASALAAFITGLSDAERVGSSATVTLNELGITEARMQRMILSLSTSGNLLTRSIQTANTAWSENTALQNEASKRYKTTESLLIMLKNSYADLKVEIGSQLTPALRKLITAATEVLQWAKDQIAEHKALVPLVTALAASFGTLAVGIAGYTIVTKIATAVSAAFTAVLDANPVFLAITAVAALVAGVSVLVSTLNDDAIPSVKELTEASRECTEVFESAAGIYDTTEDSVLGTAALAETLTDRLKKLEDQGLKTKESQEEYGVTVDTLNAVLPELNATIDEQTGKLQGGTAAVYAYIDSWKRLAIEAALQEQYKTETEAWAKANAEVYTNKVKLNKATAEGDVLQKKYNETYRECEDVGQQIIDLQSNATKYSDEYQEKLANLIDRHRELSSELDGVSDNLRSNEKEQKNLNKAIEEGEATVSDYDQILIDAKEALAEFDNASKGTFDLTGNLDTDITTIGNTLQQLGAKYNEVYDAAYESISGQVGLFDDMTMSASTSADELIRIWQTQTEYMLNYAENYKTVAEWGLDDELLRQFSDGSMASAQALDGIVKNGQDKIQELNTAFAGIEEGKQAFSDAIADVQVGLSEKLELMQQDFDEAVEGMDLNEEAYHSAVSTIDGFIAGLDLKTPTALARVQTFADSVKNTLNKTLDINSPSKEAEWSASMFAEGFNLGIEKNTAETKAVMQAYANNAVSAEETQIVALAPQLMAAIGAMGRGAQSAEAITPQSSVTYQFVLPAYHIEGVKDAEGVEAVLDRNNDSLREFIEEVILENSVDSGRRRYD